MATDERHGAPGQASALPLRLLLVDDELEFLRATERALQRRGFAVTCASDGTTALALAGNQNFDVAVLDVKMPGLDGVEVFRHLKGCRPDLPVILLTGHGAIQQAFETSKEGVHEYLTKPCDVDQLAEVARQAAQARRHEVEAKSLERDERSHPATAIRLLLVDDEHELLDSLARSLERRGITVACAGDASEALAVVARQTFDVALVDARLPGMDGLALMQRLKAADPLLEVLILTGHPSMDTGVSAVKEGAFDCLMKPQSPDLLATKIREAFHVRERRARQERADRVAGILTHRRD